MYMNTPSSCTHRHTYIHKQIYIHVKSRLMYSTHIHTYMPASRRTCTHPHTQTNPLIRIHAHARTDTHRHASNYGNRRNKSLPRRSSKIAREFSTNFIRHYFSPCPLVLFCLSSLFISSY